MCGIAGIVSLREALGPEWIGAMAGAMRHRGPDDEGYLAAMPATGSFRHLTGPDSKVAGDPLESHRQPAHLWLGHRRLSIIDVTASGHQPMSSAGGAHWIVYNGEIYNYIELRRELEAAGASFVSQSDTEVILAAYEKWGCDCVARFNGMWAFAIWDRRQNLLFGSRDRWGVKPFFYVRRDSMLLFASEIKALLRAPGVETTMNEGAAFDYLVIGLEDFEEETFFRGIHELPPATNFCLDLAGGDFRTWSYHRLEVNEAWEKFSAARAAAYIQRTRELVFSATRIRLRADVPLGSCLSGGIDSSVVVGVVDRLLQEGGHPAVGESQAVYTATYPGEACDESPFARAVVERTRTDWHQVHPNARGLLADLEDLVLTQETPFNSSSIYAHYCVCRAAAACGTKVLLDGQGGDEVFAGYQEFYRAFFLEALRRGAIGRLVAEWRSLGRSPLTAGLLLHHVQNSIAKRLLPVRIRRLFYRRRHFQNRYLHPDFWNRHQSRIDRYRGRDFFSLNRMLHEFVSRFQLKILLRYEDRNSMRFAVESRTPFADDLPLIEYMFSIPSSYKIYGGRSKYLLREATKDLLPQAIYERRDKKGFVTPELTWFRQAGESLRDYFDSDLGDILQVEKLKNEWQELLLHQPGEGMTPAWRLLNLAAWKRAFAVRAP